MDSLRTGQHCHGSRPVLEFKTATPLFFFGAWCCFLYGMFFCVGCIFRKSLQRLNSRDLFFHSIRGLVMVLLGQFTLMNPPKVMGVLRASKGWTHKIFLMVSYGFSQALFFFSYGGFLSRKHRLRERQICQIWVEVNDQRTSSTRDLDLSRSPI